MQTCKQCHQAVASDDPFCSSCGQERIVESLHASRERPPWLDKATIAVASILGVWLIITIGVAFLREAKALRRARSALEAHQPVEAYEWVFPFVTQNPNHVEALYLAGNSAIKANKPKKAAEYYYSLAKLSANQKAMERARILENIYRTQISINAGYLQCGQSPYAAFYESYRVLGSRFNDTLVGSGASVARKCVLDNNQSIANEPGYWLINEVGMDSEFVVRALYVEPLEPAIERGQYRLAQQLAFQGTSQWPEAKSEVDRILGEIRKQVSESVALVQSLCDDVIETAAIGRGRSACFPASPPDAVAGQQDAWGNPLVYSPLPMGEDTQCHSGFEVASLGADAKPTADSVKSPAMEIVCRYERGRQRLQLPDRFWLPPA